MIGVISERDPHVSLPREQPGGGDNLKYFTGNDNSTDTLLYPSQVTWFFGQVG